MNTLVKLKLLVGTLFIVGCSAVSAHNGLNDLKNCLGLDAPTSLAGADLVFQIEKTTTTLTDGYPYKGVVVKRYKKDGKFTAQGTGTLKGIVPDNQLAFNGTYKYQRTGPNTATEKLINTSVNNTPSTIKYTFETSTSGKWEEDFGNGQLKLSGSFTLEPSNLPAEQHLALAAKADSNVALIIKATKSDLPAGVYPMAGLVLQTYAADGTMVFKGFGPGTVNSTGTYKYTKVSANTAVEEVTQVSEFFTFPYTMVYTFETSSSGKWFQNFGDGLILFSGTFDVFPNK
ncbi:hypothetical protein GCM10011613_03800 [Cellvibrio zantedeschiae]|uniref:DUF4198 domain-containing protein n=1 Tax=Cellvibrio zantedeschiae TaxID=1237077 RepID=A0ABQ3APQ8_9GAMM|nr:hypothetical protein [Cellvibrio zantedeschiae]GGY63339.1 hypothetical protein GCM10011613_03800 [Cellvibrio zantedeschiae]